MKILYVLFLSLICIHLYACDKVGEIEPTDNPNNSSNIPNTDTSKMKITIGAAVFTATFSNNATAKAFKASLPITVNMADLNANEKHFDLANSLPSAPSNPGIIQLGDLMLYGSNTLVLFYKSFSTSYSYTRIGTIDNPSGLTAALGSGSITIIFERQ